MCSTLAAPWPWTVRATLVRKGSKSRAASMVVTGLAAGLTGTALFIVIHSLLIFPIWTRFLGHVPLALAAGVGLAGAFEQAARLRGWRSVSDGARFGLVMFATLVPATAFSNVLRLAGIHANDWPGSVGSLALALGSGAAAGWIVTRRCAGILTFAAATLALTVAMAGPIPIVNGPRAAWLFAGFLPICIGAGIAVALARAMFRRQESS